MKLSGIKMVGLLFLLSLAIALCSKAEAGDYYNKYWSDPLYGTSFTIGVAHKLDHELQGNNPGAIFRVNKKVSKYFDLEVGHFSQWFENIPFNNREEEELNYISINYTYRYKR